MLNLCTFLYLTSSSANAERPRCKMVSFGRK